MQEVIDELLKAEAEAQKIIAAAQEEARIIKTQVDTEFSQKLNDEREAARRAVREQVEQAGAELSAAHTAALREAREKNEARLREAEAGIERLTDEVIRLVVVPEYEKE
jgi:hypothetical protein